MIAREPDDEDIDWTATSFGDGSRVGRRGTWRIVEWRGIGRLECSSSGADAEFTLAGRADPATFAKFCATSLLACRRYLAGALSLHASAVALPFGAIALVGGSGAGKSTTAMGLVEHHGGKFLADDVVPIDWFEGTPTISPVDDSFWLTRDASAWFGLPDFEGQKHAAAPRTRSTVPEDLAAVIQLVFDDSIDGADLQLLTGQEAFLTLSEAQACYLTSEDADAVRDFAARARLAAAVPVFRARRPRGRNALGATALLLASSLLERTKRAVHDAKR